MPSSKRRQGKFSHADLQLIVGRAIHNAHGYERDDVDQNKVEALQYYLGKPRGDEQPGRSTLQSPDVGSMVRAAIAQLTPMMSTDAVVEFEPNGQEDEDQAQMETRAVNKVVMEDEQGYVKFQIALHDTLLMRNAVCKVWCEENVSTQVMTYNITEGDEQVNILLEDAPDNVESELLSYEDGEARIKRTTRQMTPRIRNVNPRHWLIERDFDEQDLNKAAFFAERHFYSRSELIEMGYNKATVEKLPEGGTFYMQQVIRRETRADPFAHSREVDKIECYDCYIQLDLDNDGVAERYNVLWTNQRILGDPERVDFIPYATGTGMLFPHEWMGESFHDYLKPVSDAKTAALRQWADNQRNMNNARTAANPNTVDMDALKNGRPGGIVQVEGMPAEHIFPLPIQDVSQSALALMEYMDKIRTEEAGASLDMQQAEMQIVGDTAHGIERQYSSKELTLQKIGKTFAETLVRQVYLKMHEALRLFYNEPMMVKMADQWVPVDPANWQPRNHVNVIVGQTAGQRNSAQQAMMFYLQMTQADMQAGLTGQISDLQGIYKARMDWLKMAGVDNPETYMVDPSSQQAQAAAQAAQQQQQAMQQLQMQMVQMQQDFEKYKHDTELQYKYFDTVTEADLKEGAELSKAQIEAAKLADAGQGRADEAERAASEDRGKPN